MRIDPILGAVPALSGQEILDQVPGIRDLADCEVIDFSRQPGPHWTLERMWELSELVRQHGSRTDLSGIVITHGTDTMEETAYLVDLRYEGSMPVVFVGAMRNSSELGWDGPANLYGAVRVACDAGAVGRGVLLSMNETVHAARDVTKADTQALDAFQSPRFGPLGVLEPDRVMWRRTLPGRDGVRSSRLVSPVDLFRCYVGMDDRWITCAVNQGTNGLVIEAMGRGNVPPALLPGIQAALDRKIPVLIATRSWHGRVLGTYGYEGSGGDLRRRGAISAGYLPGHKARIKLMLLLGRTQDPVEIGAAFSDLGYNCPQAPADLW